jgi:LacI family transcriptional regulator
MTDVAEIAGCSTTTVSHVLNGTRAVAADTRRRVERAIEQAGYRRRVTRPGHAPRHLAAVGITLPLSSSPYFAEVVQGVERELSRAGRVLLVADTHDDPEVERRAVASLLAHRIEAFIVAASPGWRERSLPLLAERGVPFALLDRMVEGEFDQIGVENEPASQVLVEHLLRAGHRRVGMISGRPGLSTTEEREIGYLRAHRRHQVGVDRTLIERGGSDIDGGRRAMHRLLDRAGPPTAVFVADSAMAIGVLGALGQRGLRMPEDIALVAFDDFELSGLVPPGLTVAAQPCHALGARVVQLLMARLADPRRPAQRLRVPASIEHRASCGCGAEGTAARQPAARQPATRQPAARHPATRREAAVSREPAGTVGAR